jgi:glycine cleavage system aminomethyltransferase T
VLEERGVLRAHQVVRIAGIGEGEITSGSFSPTLSKSIALARVPMATGDRAEVEISGKWYRCGGQTDLRAPWQDPDLNFSTAGQPLTQSRNTRL